MNEKPAWYDELKKPPTRGGFTESRAREILARARATRGEAPRRRSASPWLGAAAVVAAVVVGVPLVLQQPDDAAPAAPAAPLPGVGQLPGRSVTSEPNGPARVGAPPAAGGAAWAEPPPRGAVYDAAGKKLFEAFPGGDFVAGTPAGCWWNIYGDIEELVGKLVWIDARHADSGLELRELEPTKLSYAHVYEESFLRVASGFGLPLPGRWDFDIYIDGQREGTYSFDVPDGSWAPDGMFRSGDYELVGKEGKLGVLSPGFLAGRPNKYMWYFWGRSEELTGELHITAVKQGEEQVLSLAQASLAPYALNGADASMPTTLTLPEPGRWRLMASVDDKLFGSIVVEVGVAGVPDADASEQGA